jgi:5'(3')-deoxyribonucleotidase
MTSKQVVAAIDVDDVLASMIPEWTKIAAKLFGIRSDLLPVDWTFSNYGLTKEQINQVWKEVANRHFWYNLPRMKDAPVGAMHRLRGVTKYFVTARNNDLFGGACAQELTSSWISEQFYHGEPRPCVITGVKKGEVCRVLGVTHFLDDAVANCLDAVEHSPDTKVYLKSYSHNQNFSHPKIQRVASFDEFATIVSREAGK